MVIRKAKRGEAKGRKLGQMKILAERNVRMVELDIDVDNKTLNIFARQDYGKSRKTNPRCLITHLSMPSGAG